MKNINYKYVTLILAFALMVTYAWHWEAIFTHKNTDGMNMSGMKMDNMNKKTSHTMQMPDGSMMEMSNDSMNMGGMNMGGNMMDMTMSDMVKMMDGKTGRALEKEFITGMIPHHQGAVNMSKRLLEDKTISAEMRKFGEDIITAQEAEIKMMNEWLKKY